MLENRLLEIIIIALVVMVLFGAKRLPDTARSLGKSLRILKAESRAGRDEAVQQEQAAKQAEPPVLLRAEATPVRETPAPVSEPAAKETTR
ncbi:Sec-independent protein translocase subunit TatA [Streptomyces melanogenes]|uniref:Sec-independent protein translocase subunit TatA n=1 Tax=Streptomyces melanogenes TaxID=67326 RepID=UPI00167D3A0F|nr:Sec-independent protein translocase subunit TatA [Streptomyces melanogenes]GGP92500.1 Sec-independent protein translocase protein TatA [Streptomyces melanogenes]